MSETQNSNPKHEIPPKHKHIFNTITKNTFEFNGNITGKASKSNFSLIDI